MNRGGGGTHPSLPSAWSGAGRDRGVSFRRNRGTMHMQLQRKHGLFLTLLLILAAVSWALLIWLSRTAMTMGMGLTMGMGAGLFLAIWVVMMIAMMFPATAPMNLTFAQVQGERGSFGRAFVPPWVFVGAYLLIWTLFGGLAALCATFSPGPHEHRSDGYDDRADLRGKGFSASRAHCPGGRSGLDPLRRTRDRRTRCAPSERS
jgi:hypothetical protein